MDKFSKKNYYQDYDEDTAKELFNRNKIGMRTINLFSFFTYDWVNPLIRKGVKRQVTEQMGPLFQSYKDNSVESVERYENIY